MQFRVTIVSEEWEALRRLSVDGRARPVKKRVLPNDVTFQILNTQKKPLDNDAMRDEWLMCAMVGAPSLEVARKAVEDYIKARRAQATISLIEEAAR